VLLLIGGIVIYYRLNKLDQLNVRFGTLSDSFSPDNNNDNSKFSLNN
jgi:hypothetical protein